MQLRETLIIAGILGILPGCASGNVTPSIAPNSTVSLSPSPTRSEISFPTPPLNWNIYSKSTFQLALPSTWKEVRLDDASLKGAIENAQTANPPLADTLRGVLDSGQNKTLAFYAVDETESEVLRNVAIARVATQGGANLEEQAKKYAAALPGTIKGAQVVATQIPLTVNGISAAEIDYDLPLVNAGGQLETLRGVQYLFLLDSGDLYIVTITGDSKDSDKLVPLARDIAHSFVGVTP